MPSRVLGAVHRLTADARAVELGLVIGKTGRDIPQAAADAHVAGYGAHTRVPGDGSSLMPVARAQRSLWT